MKIGAEDKKKVIVMGVLLVIAIPLVIRSFKFGGSGTPAAAAPPAAADPQSDNGSAGRPAQAQRKGAPRLRDNSLDPTLHTDSLMASQKVEYSGGTRNIFRAEEAKLEALPQPIAPTRPPVMGPPPVQDPPKPQIPLKFYGFSNRPGEPRRAFLLDGDNIFVAVEGEVVERRYKIMKITNNFVLVEDILNNNQQTISLTLPQTTG